jgi:hypothetical protein
VHKAVIFVHHKSGPNRVHKLEDSGNEENESYDITAESLQAKKKVSHG